MSMERRIVRLEGYRRDREAVTGVLFTYTDDEGHQRERVVVTTGETLEADEFRARYPAGVLGDFQYAGIVPDWL